MARGTKWTYTLQEAMRERLGQDSAIQAMGAAYNAARHDTMRQPRTREIADTYTAAAEALATAEQRYLAKIRQADHWEARSFLRSCLGIA